MTCRILKIANADDWKKASIWLKKRSEPDPLTEKTVCEIISSVRENGDQALENYCRQFDCPTFRPPFLVARENLEEAARQVSEKELAAISRAAAHIRSFHEAQKEKSWFVTREDGSILGQRILPVDSAGLYVPGGRGGETPLVSSLLMNAIPAQVAGCGRIAVVTPPRQDGSINPYLLATAHILGLEEIYRVGGAWSIAALAYGTESVSRVDVIAGPGNIYVTTAKKQLQGQVGIDMIAGPSEVLVIAEDSANPRWIAADMLSQAEHDRLASAICLTSSEDLANAVAMELQKQLETLPRREIAAKSLADWGCIAITPDMKTAVETANAIAPEHLELCVKDPWSMLPFIRHAGAVFMGEHTPEPVGDYFAGPNHVLPTLGTARFSSSLSVQTFCKKTNIIAASSEFLRRSSEDIAALARLEELEAHARSVEARFLTD